MFALLGLKKPARMLDFALAPLFIQFNVQVRVADVAVILRNFVFQNNVVPKRVPRKIGENSVVLVTIFSIMRKDQIGLDSSLQLLKELLDLLPSERKETVPKMLDYDLRFAGPFKSTRALDLASLLRRPSALKTTQTMFKPGRSFSSLRTVPPQPISMSSA